MTKKSKMPRLSSYIPIPDHKQLESTSVCDIESSDSGIMYQSSGLHARKSSSKVFTVSAAMLIFCLGAYYGISSSQSDPSLPSLSALFPFPPPSDGDANKIEVCVQEMILTTLRPSVGALVECWDKDIDENNDIMGEGKTGADGCVTISYKNTYWDGILGRGDKNPDIFCSVNKATFVQYTPPDLDHHDQSKLAKFEAYLFRDRSKDYGRVNKCGPEFLEHLGLNEFATDLLGFEEECNNHDKCYYDCQIFLASNSDPGAAQEFATLRCTKT